MTGAVLKLMNLSITASYLILGVLFLRLIFRKIPKTVTLWLWSLVGLRLALPFSLESALSLIPKGNPIPADIALSPAPAIDTGIPVINQAVNPVIAESFTPDPLVSANPLQLVLPVLGLLWLLGIGVMLLYALVSYLRLRKRVSASLRLRDNIFLCDHIPTPFLLGLVKPKIYLPSDMAPEHQDHVLRHEYAHLRHHDNWWKILMFLVLSVYWFHPLVWVSYLLFCRDLEMACDERAVKDLDEENRKEYSRALLACAAPKHTLAVCPVAFGEGSVRHRIRNVLVYHKAARWVIAMVLILAGITAVCFFTNPREDAKASDWVVTYPLPNDAYTYQNGDLQLHFENVSRMMTRTLREKSGESYEQTALLLDRAGYVSVMLPNLGQGDKTWQLRETSGTLAPTVLTGSVSRLFLTKNEYELVSPNGHPVLLIKRGASLTLENGELRPATAQAALALDRSTGEILYSYQPNQQVYSRIACHLALALTVLEDHGPEELVDTRDLAAYLESNPSLEEYAAMYTPRVEELEALSVENLIALPLMAIGTHYDAIGALARFDADSDEAMVQKMNDYVSSLCPNTHFTDLYGYTDGQYTTAEDLLTLVNLGLNNPVIAKIWGTHAITLFDPDVGADRAFPGRNYMMDEAVITDFYDTRVTGGFATINDLVVTARADGREALCILLGAERRMDEEIDWIVRYYGNFEEMGGLLNTVLAGG